MVNQIVIPILAEPGAAQAQRQRKRQAPKGRQTDPAVQAEVQGWWGAVPPRRDQLIEALHVINDRLHCLPAPHLVALAQWMKLAMVEVYEVASLYHHFEVLKEDAAGNLATPPAVTVRVCDGLSCEMAGAPELLTQLLQRLPAMLGAKVRVLPAPCVGRCDTAPVGRGAPQRAGPRHAGPGVGCGAGWLHAR